jgi:hypothetical protein
MDNASAPDLALLKHIVFHGHMSSVLLTLLPLLTSAGLMDKHGSYPLDQTQEWKLSSKLSRKLTEVLHKSQILQDSRGLWNLQILRHLNWTISYCILCVRVVAVMHERVMDPLLWF